MTLRIVQPGLLTTVQDLGRHGHQRDGVPPSGAMDEFALRLANILVGNGEGDAGLEITLVGPTTLSFKAIGVRLCFRSQAASLSGSAGIGCSKYSNWYGSKRLANSAACAGV